eukprot:1139787-Pelagomonas_calceolata.AAC.1
MPRLGRAPGDTGQASFVGYPSYSGWQRQSHPDHFVCSRDILRAVHAVEIAAPDYSSSDHCFLSMTSSPDVPCDHVDWDRADHECIVGRCVGDLVQVVWKDLKAEQCVACLEANVGLRTEFQDAI